MSQDAIVTITLVVGVGIASVLIATMVRSIWSERRSASRGGIWSNFGLSIAFLALFLISWIAQAVAEWGSSCRSSSRTTSPCRFGRFLVVFGQSTFENWQSEFLQLFSFVVFSAILIHHGSAESKDGTDRLEEAVKRIERRLDDAGIGSSSEAGASE